jgi:RecA/RadA recombinase
LNSDKQEALLHVLADLQKQFGENIVTKANQSKVTSFVSTSFPQLDSLLDGGVQRGRLTHLIGKPTGGMTTLALKVVAAVQQTGETAVYVDLACAFDPQYAVFCGVNPAQLLLLRPSFETALSILFDVVTSGIPGVVVFNATSHLSKKQCQNMAGVLERLHPALTRSSCILLLLSLPLSDETLSQYANSRLLVELSDWLRVGNEVGYQGRVTVLKHKGGNQGKMVPVTIMVKEQLP